MKGFDTLLASGVGYSLQVVESLAHGEASKGGRPPSAVSTAGINSLATCIVYQIELPARTQLQPRCFSLATRAACSKKQCICALLQRHVLLATEPRGHVYIPQRPHALRLGPAQ